MALPIHIVYVVLNLSVPEDRRVWLQARAARDAGYRVSVVCPAVRQHAPGHRVVHGIDVHYVAVPGMRGPAGDLLEALAGTWRATRLVRRLPLRAGDILQVCTPPDSLFLLLRWARRRGLHTVYDQHDVVPLLARTKRLHGPFVRLYEWMEAQTVRAAVSVITAGQEQANRLGRLYCVTAVVIRTTAPDLVTRHSPRETARVVGYVGVMGSQDGVDGLIRSVGVLRTMGSTDVRLELAGDGPQLPRLQRLAKELGLGDTVRFHGWLNEVQLMGFLDGVDCLVVPDPLIEFNHTCPMLKVTHALAYALPVVMTPLRENLRMTCGLGWVARGDAPEQLADAIAECLAAPALERADAGAGLRHRFERFLDWERHRSNYLLALTDPSRTVQGRGTE